MSCEANIPAEWQAAISNNNCPACGGQIMTDHIKRVSDNLRTVVEQLVDLGEEQMDLLLDTFGLRRKAVPGTRQAREEEPLPANFKVAENPVQDFLARTNAPHLAKRQERIKDILNRIDGAQGEPMDMAEVMADPEYDAPTQMPTMGHALENNSLTTGGGAPPSPEEIAALEHSLGADVPDLDPTLHPALQKDRMKRLVQSRGVASGSGGGSFRRSG
jgi:hypothetical protein